jgi:hypothetical protein
MADVVDRRFVRVVGAEVGFMPKSGSTGLCLFKSANFPAGKPGSAVGGVASRSRGRAVSWEEGVPIISPI